MRDSDGIGYYTTKDTFVCPDCVDEKVLANFIRSRAEHRQCSYCGAKTKSASCAPIQALVDYLSECIHQDYDIPENELGRDDGEWVGKTMDSFDLLDHIGFAPKEHQLFQDIAQAFSDSAWCRSNYYGLSATDVLRYSWGQFKSVVKHARRFTFQYVSRRDPDDHEMLPVGKVLEKITDDLAEVNVVKVLPKGTVFWRVRAHDQKIEPLTEADFCPPPENLAIQSNRMSPAGVVMFYGADSFDTAARETVRPIPSASGRVTGVKFVSQRSLRILDLTDLPPVPSFFDRDATWLRSTITFLRDFANDISAPIERDGREHVDYAPTQAFTEYVRHLMRANGKRIHGISYVSCKDGNKCYVLFCEHDDCIETDRYKHKPWLLADMTSKRSGSEAEYATPPKAPPKRPLR